MRIFRHFAPLPEELRGAVLALGNFDGVHRGHQAVIGAAAAEARRRGRPFGVLTFEPHPRQVFAPSPAPFRLTPFRVKMHQLEALGCDLAVSLHFDRAFASHSAEDFAETVLAHGLGASHVVAGYDFVFGSGRAGNAERLKALGAGLGFGVTIVEPVGQGAEIFSSTEIRERLVAGDPKGAARLLGRNWEIDGRVEAGDRIGRTLGFPTANLPLGEFLRPAEGVYAVRAGIEYPIHTEWYDAVANLGRRPTVTGSGELRFEVHLLDFAGDLYGRHLRVAFVDWIRGDAKFAGLEALKAAIADDVEAARRALGGAL
jgi:riboflavin kinase/FMN adenylyltransferase